MIDADKVRITEIVKEDMKQHSQLTHGLIRIMNKLHDEDLCDAFTNAKGKRLGRILRPKFCQIVTDEIIKELSGRG